MLGSCDTTEPKSTTITVTSAACRAEVRLNDGPVVRFARSKVFEVSPGRHKIASRNCSGVLVCECTNAWGFCTVSVASDENRSVKAGTHCGN
jgi:hypothetical protein